MLNVVFITWVVFTQCEHLSHIYFPALLEYCVNSKSVLESEKGIRFHNLQMIIMNLLACDHCINV